MKDAVELCLLDRDGSAGLQARDPQSPSAVAYPMRVGRGTAAASDRAKVTSMRQGDGSKSRRSARALIVDPHQILVGRFVVTVEGHAHTAVSGVDD